MALWHLAPHIPMVRNPLYLILLTALFMFAQLSIVRWFTSLTVKPLWAAVTLIAALVAWIAVIATVTSPYLVYGVNGRPVALRQIGKDGITADNIPKTVTVKIPADNSKGKGEVKEITARRMQAGMEVRLFVFDAVAGRMRAAASLFMIFAATALGYLVSFILREPNILLPVGALAAGIDVWSVMIGPTMKALKSVPHVVSSVSVAMPAPGSAATGYQPISFIGPADFIFLAMFLGAIYRMNLEPNRTFWIAFPILSIGMAVVLTGLFPSGLPGLVLIAGSVILANYRRFKLKRDEILAVAIVALMLIAGMLAYKLVVG